MIDLLRSAWKELPEPSPVDAKELLRVLRGGFVSKPGAFLQALRKQVFASVKPETFRSAQDFLRRSGGVAVATVQLATDPGVRAVQEMTKEFSADGKTLARVRIERDLAGGARLFRGGVMKDMSWKGRVRQIVSKITH
ncbi:MAG: hypothetical protein WCK01_01980 [Candidatus Uhrbacteria bacterium]